MRQDSVGKIAEMQGAFTGRVCWDFLEEVASQRRLENRKGWYGRKEHQARLPTRSKAWQWKGAGPAGTWKREGRGVARNRAARMRQA